MDGEDCEIIVWKEPPANDGANDGLNAKQRRKQKKRAEGLASANYLDQVARELRNKRLKQANRWVDYQMRTNQLLGYQNEIRWGLKTGNTHMMSDEAQYATDRLERERSAALSRLNRARKEADPGAKDEVWVDDWFGQGDAESAASDVDRTGVGVTFGAGPVVEEDGGMQMELDGGVEEGEEVKGKAEVEGKEEVDDADYMSGVEMDGNGL